MARIYFLHDSKPSEVEKKNELLYKVKESVLSLLFGSLSCLPLKIIAGVSNEYSNDSVSNFTLFWLMLIMHNNVLSIW